MEFLIVGQGLAGTALAWELIWRGRDVLVVDAGEAVTSSKIAAGLVTPITGQRLALGWRVDEMLAAARPYYERVAVVRRRRWRCGGGVGMIRRGRRILRVAGGRRWVNWAVVIFMAGIWIVRAIWRPRGRRLSGAGVFGRRNWIRRRRRPGRRVG